MAKEEAEPSDAEISLHEGPSKTCTVDNNEARESDSCESVEPPLVEPSLISNGDELDATSNLQSNPAVSQPMTTSNSSSSTPSVKEIATGAASPYGTRSRNRGGASRPNYAEDRELEMEYDVQAPTKEEDSKKSSRPADAHSSIDTEFGVPANTFRRGIGTLYEYDISDQTLAKDHIPGTSTFSANPTGTVHSQPSKKRKAPAQSTPNTTNAIMPVNGLLPASQPTTRRASLAAQAGTAYKDSRYSNMLSFETHGGRLKDGKLTADDGTVLAVNDHVYLVCEPPGEPYYLGRIMEFLHVSNDSSKPIDALRLNWYYRPKDIGRKVNDTRQVFASMHSDISPLTALRGLCQIKHKSEVHSMEELRNTQDCFWYEKLFDRYIHRYYEVIPTSQVVNVPANVKRVLDDRWKFILVESGRGKELTSAVKSCKRCSGYCASNDSVDCAVCHQTYHMNCVRPPLLKKPSRGFAWACGPCSRAQERKLEARNTPNLADTGLDADDEEMVDEDEDEAHLAADGLDTGGTSPARSVDQDTSIHPGTAEQIHQASLWPFRYLGVHCKVEDALDYDDRIYPRASSRLGPRHQANVTIWHGRAVEFVKPADIKRKYVKGGGHKKDAKLSKETVAALEADKMAREKRPKWVMDEPPGYIRRGEDYDNEDLRNTAELLFKVPEIIDESSPVLAKTEQLIDDYMVRAERLAKVVGVPKYSVNFLDKALSILFSNNYDAEAALRELSKVDKKQLKEPELTPGEVKKFEDGVAKFGSELHSVKKHVKTVSAANIVRFYYAWKKTERGKLVWGNYAGRKGKKEAKKAEANASTGKLQDDVADDHDDSAFDNDKAMEKNRRFQCKFCSVRYSSQWRRAPNTAAGTMVLADPNNKLVGKDKGEKLMVALCLSCAVVWRKYAVQREDGDDHGKKAAQNGGKTTKRKMDDSQREFQLNEISWTASNTDTATTPSGGTPMPQTSGLSTLQEPARKKARGGSDRDPIDPATLDASGLVTAGQQKKKVVEKPPGPPPAPEIPKPKIMPCAICLQMEPMGDQHLSCKECRMTVHRNCYGVVAETRGLSKWVCDMCANDRSPQVSTNYICMLCPHRYTEQDFIEPPKSSHKKKTEKEREKDRVEREISLKTAEFYRKKQEEMNRPVNPREPLKRTANNNWVHVTCAVWTPEVKFSKAKALELCEGIPSIPTARYDEVCKACKKTGGACVACHACRIPVHVECAHQNGYVLGFDIAPVKGSRRDQFNIVSINGEAGTMTAAIWCKEHHPTKTIVHRMEDIVDETTGLNALQLYVQNFKEADLTLTGTVRKATLVNQSTKVQNTTPSVTAPNRRSSTTTAGNGARGSISNIKVEEMTSTSIDLVSRHTSTTDLPRTCVTCQVGISPKWWPYPSTSFQTVVTAVADNPSPFVTAEAREQEIGQVLANGQGHQNNTDESPKAHMDATAVVVDKRLEEIELNSGEVQCHKCHHRKVKKPPPSPSQLIPPKPEIVHVQTVAPPPRALTPPVLANSPPVQATSHYGWPHQQAYSPPPRPYNDWSRPSPGPSQPHAIHQYNGSRSPRGNSNSNHSLNNPPQIRQTVVNMPQSPRFNGPLGSQITNGYPGSPHRSIGGSHQSQNGAYGSYVAQGPPPQHLTNGGPPPRAPENPFSQHPHGPLHHHPAFGSSHGSPPINREPLPPNREPHNQGHIVRSSDGRVNGGASASPSLHNLLS